MSQQLTVLPGRGLQAVAEARGRVRPPNLAIVDTQCVRCFSLRGPQGYDAGKKVMRRKRVVIVDSDRAMLVAAVVPGTCRTGTAWRC